MLSITSGLCISGLNASYLGAHTRASRVYILTMGAEVRLHATCALNGANTHFCKILFNLVFSIVFNEIRSNRHLPSGMSPSPLSHGTLHHLTINNSLSAQIYIHISRIVK